MKTKLIKQVDEASMKLINRNIIKEILTEKMRIDRVWAMPNRWTFTIKPIRELLMEEIPGTLLHQESGWADPFAGNNSPAVYTNDMNPNTNARDHFDALWWLKSFTVSSLHGVLYDPPYSFRQASECYKSCGKEKLTATVTNKKYWMEVKNEIARIIKVGGKCISFGWNTNGLGKGRGFRLDRILIVAHGGSMNDTLVTVETKL